MCASVGTGKGRLLRSRDKLTAQVVGPRVIRAYERSCFAAILRDLRSLGGGKRLKIRAPYYRHHGLEVSVPPESESVMKVPGPGSRGT